MRTRRLFSNLVFAALALFAIAVSGYASDLKPEEIVARSLDSIGTADARAAVKSIGIQGALHFKILTGGTGESSGNWGYVSEQRKSNFVMKFGSGPWHGERFAFDGEKTSFAVFTSTRRPSPFGNFVYTEDYLIKEGWLGGELSTGWALENLAQKPVRFTSLGPTKIDGRELEGIECQARGNSDMKIKLYFEPESFRHVMTVYSLIFTPGTGHVANKGGGGLAGDQGQMRYIIEERFSDFRNESGITLPRRYDLRYTQETQRGSTFNFDWDMTAERIFVNIPVDPANFVIK